MRSLFWLLTLAALAVGLAVAGRYNTGYVLLVMPPWRAEVSLNFFLLSAAGGFILLYWAVRLVSHTLALPRAVAAFRQRRRLYKATTAHFEAARLLQEGRFGHALRSAEKAWADHPVPGAAALIGWRAAHSLRDAEREALWTERARAADDQGFKSARLMIEAEFALEERRFEDARAALQTLALNGGRHIAALRLALRAERGLGHWNEAEKLVRQLEKHKALTPEQALPLRSSVLREELRNLHGNKEGLLRYWRSLDVRDRAEPLLACKTAQALIAANASAEAQQIIEYALKDCWEEDLVLAYAQCTGGDVIGRIAQAEKWLAQHPRDSALLLTLGRLCRQQQLWGKAQSYLESSLAIASRRETHIELAQLFDQLENSALALRHYQAAVGVIDETVIAPYWVPLH
ncbi:MAG: heme biosynthesis HemY N-terminal domain-containing protein [Rugosibacter sp.]|nr:heme biosynthesis HemY N-terminal domain-containing protein [Rugosibacter sp.]